MFGGVYVLLNSETERYISHYALLEEIIHEFTPHQTFIFGDFDLPVATWFDNGNGVMVDCPLDSSAPLVAQFTDF